MFGSTDDPTVEVVHRPWPLPRGPWIMAQRWNDLLFAHWPVARDALAALVPPSLPIDSYDGTAWVSITPFRLRGLRPRYLPPFPGLSAFPELNVRTYVTLGGKPGVWFFSLDAGSLPAVLAARAVYHLPYFRAAMSVHEARDGSIHYHSRRAYDWPPPADFSARYRPTGAVARSEPGSLDHWLTERYCLYAVDAAGHVHRAEIHHRPWPLQPAEAGIERNTMAAAAGITLPSEPPRLAFARRLDVVVWPPTRVAAGA
ncbi:MAG TPA: DUF2071 domain-containing protein [Gemmatimonadaceae bacterium]|nr:DUF2071 domain-containing protein [Gemmatimonadaceae bacterium]